MKTLILLLCIISFSSFSSAQDSITERKKATILVLIDLSSSMPRHRKKLTQLAPIVKEAMERSQCDIKVGVGGIHYNDNKKVSMKPWGKPAWITKDMENGSKVIADRIEFPYETIFNRQLSEEDEDRLPNGNSERTYSSIVKSIEANLAELKGQAVVGTLLVTDAAPGYELFTPIDAKSKIKSLLSDTPYVSGVIGPQLWEGMKIPSLNNDQERLHCQTDFHGTQTPGAFVNKSSWTTQDIESLNEFVKETRGWKWDVCEPTYDRSLQEFLQMILDAAGCQLTV